ncbi:MAG: hypothetical protein K1X95_11495 [Acidimicrobiia bacterium]|nr:hypothetical protein [Acidimicrobiia bacterium]
MLARHDSVDHANRYDRFLVGMYLVWRWLSVLIYGPATIETYRRYRRPALAVGAWLLLAGEMAWSSVHLSRGSRSTSMVIWVDSATAAVIAAAFPHAVASGAPEPWHAWGAEHANFQAEAVPFLVEHVPARLAAIAFLAGAPLLGCVLGPGPTDWRYMARTTATTVVRSLMTGLFADQVRANVVRLDAAHARALSATREVALQRSRTRHRHYLQHRSLRVLDAVAGAAQPRSRDLRHRASTEAARLRSMLMPADGRHAELADVVAEAAEHGVDLEVVSGEVAGVLRTHVVESIRAEVATAFRGTGGGDEDSVSRAVLFVDTVDETLVVTLRGAGVRRDLRFDL